MQLKTSQIHNTLSLNMTSILPIKQQASKEQGNCL